METIELPSRANGLNATGQAQAHFIIAITWLRSYLLHFQAGRLVEPPCLNMPLCALLCSNQKYVHGVGSTPNCQTHVRA